MQISSVIVIVTTTFQLICSSAIISEGKNISFVLPDYNWEGFKNRLAWNIVLISSYAKTRFNVRYVNNSSQIYRQNEFLFSIFLNTSFETANKIFQKTEILLKRFRRNFMYASIEDTILLASSKQHKINQIPIFMYMPYWKD